MAVAPFESCVACLRGDTDTALVLRGEAEFVVAVLHAKLGLPIEQATGTVQAFAEQELGCEPGKVPEGWSDHTIRLCQDCAAGAGLSVEKVGAGTLPGYAQPADEGGEV